MKALKLIHLLHIWHSSVVVYGHSNMMPVLASKISICSPPLKQKALYKPVFAQETLLHAVPDPFDPAFMVRKCTFMHF